VSAVSRSESPERLSDSEPRGAGVEGSATSTSALVALVDLLRERNMQLERALESRIVIEQAKGVLLERLGLDADQAFEILRRAARSQRRRIHLLAAEVVASRDTPTVIRAAAAALHVNGAASPDDRA
jgi:hypothetical protein